MPEGSARPSHVDVEPRIALSEEQLSLRRPIPRQKLQSPSQVERAVIARLTHQCRDPVASLEGLGEVKVNRNPDAIPHGEIEGTAGGRFQARTAPLPGIPGKSARQAQTRGKSRGQCVADVNLSSARQHCGWGLTEFDRPAERVAW